MSSKLDISVSIKKTSTTKCQIIYYNGYYCSILIDDTVKVISCYISISFDLVM